MWDLETMNKLNNQPKAGEKVSSDGRVCTSYHSKATGRFFVEIYGQTCGIVYDSIMLQGQGTFGPMPFLDAVKLCELLNSLTRV